MCYRLTAAICRKFVYGHESLSSALLFNPDGENGKRGTAGPLNIKDKTYSYIAIQIPFK
jgi:hypothetical protein